MKDPKQNTNPNQDLFDMGFQRILCLDFDGVFHGYRQGWKGPTNIYDEPVPGSFEWLTQIANARDDAGEKVFDPQIYSSRSKLAGGVDAMRAWFTKHGLDAAVLMDLSFPTEKPAAFLTIDDRCFQFRGVFPSEDYILGYASWVSDTGTLPIKSDADLLRQIAIEGLQRGDAAGREVLMGIANRIDGRTG